MDPITLIIIGSLVWFLNKQESDQNIKPIKQEEDKSNDADDETSSHNRAGAGGNLSRTANPKNRNRRVKPTANLKEELSDAGRKTTKNTDHDSVLDRESGTATVESGDAIPSPEVAIEGSADTSGSE